MWRSPWRVWFARPSRRIQWLSPRAWGCSDSGVGDMAIAFDSSSSSGKQSSCMNAHRASQWKGNISKSSVLMCHPLNMFLYVFPLWDRKDFDPLQPRSAFVHICSYLFISFNPDTTGRSSCHLSASQIFLLSSRFSPLPRYTKGVKLDIAFLGSSAKMTVSNQSPFDSLEGTRCPVPTQSHPSFLFLR